MNTFTECLKQITNLTKKNLQILKMINDSFYTKKNHLVSNIDGEQYVIPSFLSLESKIDNIEANLQNILDAPKTGEAFTYYDGTTQKIELAGYSTVPPKVDLQVPEIFSSSINHIFKDFMSPQPSVRFDIGSIANNIKHVLIKKLVIINPNLLNLVLENVSGDNIDETSSSLKNGSIKYGDLVKTLFNYEEDVDYIDYDTVKRLPLRANNPTGEYNIIEIIDNWQDSNFEEHYILKLDSDLVYHIYNGTIQRNIAPGDYLVTHNDKVEMIVEEVNPVNRTLTVKILYGAYANLSDIQSGNIGMYGLKYHKVNDELFSQTKYIEVSLEEDRNVCIFIAPINDITNTQAAFGEGVYLNTDFLIDENGQSFRKYYDDNVNNIGDALFAITNMMNDDDQVEKLSAGQYFDIISNKPIINDEYITVYQINKHLNDSESVQKIRNLYHQKVQYKNDLADIENQIDQINDILAGSSFDDVDEVRETYKTQLSELNLQRRELTQNIISIVQEISENANSSDTPIENAKYHIRGFINTESDIAEIIGLDVEYRYKNKNKFTGNAVTIGESYIYSDWNRMDNFKKIKFPVYENGRYTYQWEENNESKNEPSFNQIDIPISQGENVDIRVRYIYSLGWPLVELRSDWSDIFNVEFPEEYIQNIEILDIIAENNDDIKKNQFIGILEKEGVISHVQDKVQDLDLTYFHQPEHIASGFYTPERRIIPLSDQLMSMARTLADLQSEINGATAQLNITISDGIQESQVLPGIMNNFRTQSYVDAVNEGRYQQMIFNRDPSTESEGVGTDIFVQAPMAISNLVINIYNPTDFTIKLHSIFPGDSNIILDETAASNKFGYYNYTGGGYCSIDNTIPTSKNIDDYSYEQGDGVWMLISGQSKTMQRQNQFIYFRTKVDGKSLYTVGISDGTSHSTRIQAVDNDFFNGKWPNNLISAHDDCIYELLSELKYMYDSNNNIYTGVASLYPHINKIEDITAPSGSDYYELAPGESIQIPLNFVYWLSNTTGNNVQLEGDADLLSKTRPYDNKVSRAIAFDIRTSLFADPVTYKLVVESHYQDLQTYKNMVVNKDSIKKKYTPATARNIVNRGKKRR